MAAYGGLKVYDLRRGTVIAEKPDAVAPGYVSQIEWRDDELAATVVPECEDGIEQDVRVVPLNE